MSKIKVLVIDDSATVRHLLSDILSSDTEIEVIGTAMDPVFGLRKIMKSPPDVITLDIEMPRMDGLTFLQKLMSSYPIPVVMISSHTRQGCETTLKALELGAVDFIAKPDRAAAGNLVMLKQEIVSKVKNAAKANLGRYVDKQQLQRKGESSGMSGANTTKGSARRVVVIGASTGGVVAVRKIIERLKPANYSILIALHMPAGFTEPFAKRLGEMYGWISQEAHDKQLVKPGEIYVAPGAKNMFLVKQDGNLFFRVLDCAPEDVFKPNINKTFTSVAQTAGNESIGVILTGMGDDGAKGLLALKQAGALTIAQNEETSIIFGMPKKAVEIDAVDYVLPLEEIAHRLIQLLI